MAQLPQGASLIATSVMSPFITPFKLAFFVAAVRSRCPWCSTRSGVSSRPASIARKSASRCRCCVSSIVLFYVGIAFAYLLVFPVAFHFFAGDAPAGVQVMPDINDYLDFALTMFFAFGLAFEVPVVVVLLTLTGLVTVEKLAEPRGYVIIGIFVVAAVLTPPDPLSQTADGDPDVAAVRGGRGLRARAEPRPKKDRGAGNDSERHRSRC